MSDIDTFRATSQQGRGCHVEFHVGQSVAQREISSTRLCRIAPFERPNVCGDTETERPGTGLSGVTNVGAALLWETVFFR